jgi:hypothetical protein
MGGFAWRLGVEHYRRAAAGLGFAALNNFRREFLGFQRVGTLDFQWKAWGELG